MSYEIKRSNSSIKTYNQQRKYFLNRQKCLIFLISEIELYGAEKESK